MRHVACSLVLLLAAGCGDSEVVETEPVIRPVRTTTAVVTDGVRERVFSGSARAGLASKLSFKVAGTVSRVSVEVGDTVAEGDLVAELDPEDYRLKVQEANASLQQARAALRNDEKNYERVQTLWENDNVGDADLDAARAKAEAARATVSSIETSLERLRREEGYTRLLAPSAGRIASVLAQEGENVAPGQQVALLTSEARPEVRIAVPEVLIAELRRGETARITFDAVPGRTFQGTVTEVGVAATGGVTTFPVTLALEDSSALVLPGMAAQVVFRIEPGDPRPRVLLPPVAVQHDRDGSFVYVAEPLEAGDGGEEGLAVCRRRPVEIGELTAGGLEVFAGLEEGERVVDAGVSKIQDGLIVRLQDR